MMVFRETESFTLKSGVTIHVNCELTPYQGGDAGHGGFAILRIATTPELSFFLQEQGDEIRIQGGGDWEQEALCEAIIKAGEMFKKLKKIAKI